MSDNNDIYYQSNPLVSVQNRIVDELRKWDVNAPYFEHSQTLVNYAAKNVIYNGLIKPVLFFDQFEEIFTLGPQNDPHKISRLIHQLADLIEIRLPDELKKLDYIDNITNFKIVFSLRQDWIGYLDDYSHLIPFILENRYRLRKFSYHQAIEAIIGPDKEQIPIEAAKEIIKDIGTPALLRNAQDTYSKKEDWGLLNKEVDPFVLSIYCYQLYEKAFKSNTVQISEDFVSKNNNAQLIRNYYDDKMEGFEGIR